MAAAGESAGWEPAGPAVREGAEEASALGERPAEDWLPVVQAAAVTVPVAEVQQVPYRSAGQAVAAAK